MLSKSQVFLLIGSSLPMLLTFAMPVQAPKAKSPGESLFAKACAPCHGAKGEGGAAFPSPLMGDLTVAELGKYISQSMPPGPKKTPIGDANKIATYIHDAFYSPIAQERNRPARVSLARLTVKQYRNAVSDLVGSYHPAIPNAKNGLNGQYFKNRDRSAKNRVIERVDSEVKFDFGTVGPAPDQVEPHNYSITWSGSILAPDSGEYELVIQTDHSARMWFNGSKQPIIDGWVKSGNDTEYKRPVTLLGGRAYPIYMEFSKATHGVNDDAKKKDVPPSSAFVRLMWKRPKGALEPIPTNYLFAQGMSPTYVVETPLPADDRSMGYERGTSVNRAWGDATTTAALEAADSIATRLSAVTGVADNAPDRVEKLKAYSRDFVTRAFRRPLDKETEQTYIENQFKVAPNPEVAIRRVVILALKSPRFLYREIGNRNDPYSIASELSFGLWDSVPDPELLRAAGAGELNKREGIQRQAMRLANDPRAWNKLRDFLLLWLKVDDFPDIVKSQKNFPGFDGAAATDLRTSMDLFLKDVAWDSADYRQLMLSPKQYLNGRLSKLYGGSLPAGAPFQAVESSDRSGVLTQPYFLARYAYLEGTSPIHRGVLIARSMLGRVLAPPPEAFTPLAPSLHPTLTTRQRVELQTKPAACISCHSMINPLGFTLEKYDAIGRVRKDDNGKPVDASGGYLSKAGEANKFDGASDLANYIASSGEAHAAFTEKLFQHLTKQPIRAYGAKALPNLQESFKKENYNIRNLMVSIMMTATPEPVAK